MTDEPKKGLLFPKLEEIDFILRKPKNVGFACALFKILERSKSKSITLVLNIVPGFKSKILVLSRDVHKQEYRSRLRQEFKRFSRSRIRSHKFPIVAGAGCGAKNYRILVIFVQNLP